MSPFAQRLTDVDMADLAAYYEGQRPRRRPNTPVADPATVATGRRLAEQYHCTSCHRPGLTGQQQAARRRLLRAFKAKTASDLDGTMTVATQPVREEDIEALVHFMATLGTEP